MKTPQINENAKVLQISAPNVSILEGTHKAKISDDNFIVKNVKTKKGEPMQIVSMRVQIDGHSPFIATCLDYTQHLEKNKGEDIDVRIFTKDGYKNAEV